jgi:thiosulfate/3-mercaptopyruvate sulfurtransferase
MFGALQEAPGLPMLVGGPWLRRHLGDPRLRVIEASVDIHRAADATSWSYVPAIEAWASGHVPGSALVDLVAGASDATSPLPFAAPTVAQLTACLRSIGVDRDSRIVIYDRDHGLWAARLWWVIRANGHRDVGVLDGGWRLWRRDGGPVETTTRPCACGDFVASPQPGWWATTAEVEEAVGRRGACLLSAQTSVQFEGVEVSGGGPSGRIPGSVNVHARTLTDPETHRWLPRAELAARLADAGVASGDDIVAYCGAGVAASADAFVLRLLGHDRVRVYDGSMAAWARDGGRPVERGPVPGLRHTAASRGADA